MRFIDPTTDPWRVPGGTESPEPRPAPREHALLTPEQWAAVREFWPAELPTGLLLPNTADVAPLAGDLARFELVVLQFPKWTDGRAYSQARLLRTRQRYSGELRASGDVVCDMVPLLQRAGFTAATLRAGQDVEVARRALGFFEGHYQADATASQPRFGRQAA